MAEERLRIFIEWIEEHPKKYADVIAKLEALKTQYKAMKDIIVDTTQPIEKQAKVHEAMSSVYDDHKNRIIRLIPAVRMAQDAQERMNEEAVKGVVKWEGIGKSIEKFGRKVGFTGFIVAFSIQRIIKTLQQFIKYFTDSIKATADWPDKIADVAYAMGMLQYTGLGTSDTMKLLSGTMNSLISEGPKVESLWLGLNAVWTSVQTTLATALIPALTQVLAQLGAFLVTKEAQAAMANLASAVGSLFISIAQLTPIFIQLATGFAIILNFIKPLLPIIVPLVAAMMLLGMVCSVIGPILTVLGGVIGFVVKAKRWWMVQTNLNTISMQRLKMAIVGTIGSLVIIGIMLYAMSQTATASATDVSKSFDKLSSSAVKMDWEITDANGNILYTINTLTNEVSDSTGKIIGYYDTMTGSLIRSNGSLIGTIDQASNIFTGYDGVLGKLKTTVGDLASALSSFDTSGLESGMSNLNDTANGLNGQLNLVNIAFIAMGAIQFTALLFQIYSVISGVGGIGTAMVGVKAIYTYEAGVMVASTTTLGASISSVLGMLSVAAPWIIGLTAAAIAAKALNDELDKRTEEALPGYKAIEEQTGFPVIPATPVQGQMDLAQEIYNALSQIPNWISSLRFPGFQFGGKVQRTGLYHLERGENVRSTREYGPEKDEGGLVSKVITETPQIITISNYFDIGTISSDFDAERLGDIVNRKIAESIRRKRP